MRKSILNSIFVALWLTGSAFAQGEPPAETGRLHQLFQDRFQWQMEQFPAMAMARGDYSNADRIADTSLQAIEYRHQQTKAFLDRLHTIDRSDLNADDRLNYELFELQLTRDIDGHRFRSFLMPIGSRQGIHQDIPQMADRIRFSNAQDYRNYLARLSQIPQALDNVVALMRLGIDEQRTPAKITLAGIPAQLESIIEGEALDALGAPFDRLPNTIDGDQRFGLSLAFNFISQDLRTALRKYANYITDEYLPECRDTVAATDLPDGVDYYNHQLRTYTTTNLTAQEIHDIGLSEVARIRAEMLAVIRRSDFFEGNAEARSLDDDALFDAFVHYLRTDPRFYSMSEEALLAGYRDICKRVDGWLPKLFGTLPRLPYGVKEIPLFMAPTQTTAYYQHGDIRNAEAGFFMANTYALDQRPKYEMIPLAMHEAVPGHHLQIALAQELEGLPEFRKNAYFIAFGEGWALYSERLGIETGMYEDPYNDFGRLLYEMWRACRLVVDPGMHAFGWSRDRAIQFMLHNTALSQLNIENEIDRYIGWPGQACAYKIGELKIRELRTKAENTLGERFDVRAFHDVVLGAGSLPLTALETRVNEWIDSQ
ncbi:MAG: DUF885 domain-containing protein [Phycisphaerales bacterium]